MTDLKILVCGDVQGNFKTLFSKVDMILKKKGPFESLYCVGNFFGSNPKEWEDLKSGKIKVPLSTYILLGNESSFKQFYEPLEESVPNIMYLGKMGCITCTSGLKIAYLSGTQLPEKESDSKINTLENYSTYFSKKNVDSMINTIGSGVDILLTSQWPKDVTKYAVSVSKDDESKMNDYGSCLISYLAKAIKPRYHFCGLSGLYYERVPYRNHVDLMEKPVHVTRFFALAPVNNIKKEKWLYAFNITPACRLTSKELVDNTGPATVCPYESTFKSNPLDDNFFFASSDSSSHKKRSNGHSYEKQPKKLSIDASKCWFCLSNANVERHLIITVGNHCYVTLAKGVLVPEHVFIVPINHIGSSVELSSDALEEVEKFKKALSNYFQDKGQDVVFFERNFRSPHMQIQVVSIPKEKTSQIEDELFSHASVSNLEFTKLPSYSNIQQIVSGKPYFYIETIINKKPEGKYLSVSKNIPLQFGRTLLAEILNVNDRTDWQKCQDSLSDEKRMAEKMRRNFKKYDFTEL